MMVEHRPGGPGPGEPVGALSLRLPARPGALRDLRRAVSSWLAEASWASAAVRADSLLAVTELFTNAIEAGASEVTTMMWRSGSVVRVVVTDDGPEWAPAATPPSIPEATSLRGRGLALTSRLGHLVVDRAQHRTRVTVTLELV